MTIQFSEVQEWLEFRMNEAHDRMIRAMTRDLYGSEQEWRGSRDAYENCLLYLSDRKIPAQSDTIKRLEIEAERMRRIMKSCKREIGLLLLGAEWDKKMGDMTAHITEEDIERLKTLLEMINQELQETEVES